VKVFIYTSIADQDELHALCEKTRRTSKTVTVPKHLLIGLLMDHAALADAVGLSNIEVRHKVDVSKQGAADVVAAE
jgi:hypothetical protein